MDTDPVFNVNDKVICKYNTSYALTEGKEYTVLKYEPRTPDSNFTWPAYVKVTDDLGREVVCHAQRFQATT